MTLAAMRVGSTSRSESGKRTKPVRRGEARDASSSASTATIEDPDPVGAV
jgi:hypothetical protein